MPGVHPEIASHLAWLEQETARILSSVRLLAAEIECVEAHMREFFHDYYGSVGRYFNDNTSPLRRSDAGDAEEGEAAVAYAGLATVDKSGSAVYIKHDAIKQREVKRIYRRLVKRCHPDISPYPEAKSLFRRISDSYKQGNLSQLLLVEAAMQDAENYGGETAVQRLERLEKRYELVAQEYEALLRKKEQMKASSAYELWQRVFREKARGRDILRDIKAHVAQGVGAGALV